MTITPTHTRNLRILEIKSFLTKMLSKNPLTITEWLPAVLPIALFNIKKKKEKSGSG